MIRRLLRGLAGLVLLAGCTTGGTGPSQTPSSDPSAAFPCPAIERPTASPAPAAVTGGRVRVDRISFPAAPAPFSRPTSYGYLPFAVAMASQQATIEPSTPQSMGWEASLTVGRLGSADGAWGASRAAEVVSQCSLSITWRGIDYQPRVRRDEGTRVNGHEAWIRTTDLSFSVPGVRTTSELQTVVIVQVGDDSYAFLSYLPGTAPELKDALDAVQRGLRVD